MHLRRGDWGRPQLAGRGQKIYQVASDLRRAQYVLGRGEKICLALLGEMSKTHSMLSCWRNRCSMNEQVKLERAEGEAAAEENRTAERRKGLLSKIHRRGPQDKHCC